MMLGHGNSGGWSIKTMSFHRQLSLQSMLLIQSNRIHLSHPPTPVSCVLCSDIEGFQYRKGVPIPKGVPVLKRGSGIGNPGPNMYLASYFTPDHVAIDMRVFPSAEVREYAYDGLYLMVYLGMGRPNHVTCTLFDHMLLR